MNDILDIIDQMLNSNKTVEEARFFMSVIEKRPIYAETLIDLIMFELERIWNDVIVIDKLKDEKKQNDWLDNYGEYLEKLKKLLELCMIVRSSERRIKNDTKTTR